MLSIYVHTHAHTNINIIFVYYFIIISLKLFLDHFYTYLSSMCEEHLSAFVILPLISHIPDQWGGFDPPQQNKSRDPPPSSIHSFIFSTFFSLFLQQPQECAGLAEEQGLLPQYFEKVARGRVLLL